jgi:hypothetical protein
VLFLVVFKRFAAEFFNRSPTVDGWVASANPTQCQKRVILPARYNIPAFITKHGHGTVRRQPTQDTAPAAAWCRARVRQHQAIANPKNRTTYTTRTELWLVHTAGVRLQPRLDRKLIGICLLECRCRSRKSSPKNRFGLSGHRSNPNTPTRISFSIGSLFHLIQVESSGLVCSNWSKCTPRKRTET